MKVAQNSISNDVTYNLSSGINGLNRTLNIRLSKTEIGKQLQMDAIRRGIPVRSINA